MNEQEKIEKVNLQYNQIILNEFLKNKKFVQYADNFSGEKSNIQEGFLPTTLKPRFNTRKQEYIVKNAVETIISGLKKIEKALIKGDIKLKIFMGLNNKEIEILKIPRKYKNPYPWIRFDAALIDKMFKIIEINLNFPGGPGAVDEIGEKFSKLSSIKKISLITKIKLNKGANHHLFRVFMDYYKEAGFKKAKPNLLILRWSDYDVTMDSDSIAKYFIKKGCNTVIADPRDVTFDKDCLKYKGFKANLVLKWFDLDILLERQKTCVELMKAIKSEKIVIINPLSASVMATKSSFAVMTSKEFGYLFSNKEKRAFRRHVPWTRLFFEGNSDTSTGKKIELVKYAKLNRDRIILKPAVGTCGKNVFVGAAYSQDKWISTVNKIISQKKRYIIQERVQILQEFFPAIRGGNMIFEKRRIDILPMLFDGKYRLSWSRCAYGYILNGYQGGIFGLNYTVL
ncbi:MAG: hypothetical protein AAB487_00020 [Patescibacteria group bacterium]